MSTASSGTSSCSSGSRSTRSFTGGRRSWGRHEESRSRALDRRAHRAVRLAPELRRALVALGLGMRVPLETRAVHDRRGLGADRRRIRDARLDRVAAPRPRAARRGRRRDSPLAHSGDHGNRPQRVFDPAHRGPGDSGDHARGVRMRRLLPLLLPAAALAHETGPFQPDDLWRGWTFDAGVVIPLALAAILYLRGARTDRGVTMRRQACFWAGWTVLALSLVSPLHPLGEVLFSA